MLNLPNCLTLLRIAFIPVLFFLLFQTGRKAGVIAALCFSVASLTDILDGFLARKHNTVTPIGKVMDPLADKLLITVCLIMLIPLHQVPAWVVTVLVARDLAITGLRSMAALQGSAMPAEAMGKHKTAFQTVAIIFLLLHYQYFTIDFHRIGMGLLMVALVLSVWSGVAYCVRFGRQISGEE
jgi:CDP-diacylglycerol--glycerol-3-phosphate 3-phosphatidyltransferase